MQRKESSSHASTHDGGAIMCIQGFGIGVGGSVSLPNLRRSFQRKDPASLSPSGIQTFLPPIKHHHVGEIDLASRRAPFRSCSSPSIRKGSEFFCDRRCRNPIPIPTFGCGVHDGFRKGSQVPNSTEMIVGALKASHGHFQRGVHHSDIIQLVCSAYNLSNSSVIGRTLNTTLEKLVATGVVSKSYGLKPEDATYRLVMYNPVVARPAPRLIVNGTGIKSSVSHRSKSGLCLPGSSSHLARAARTNAPLLRENKNGNEIRQDETNREFVSRAYASMSDPTLSHSLADRSGAREYLQPNGLQPPSPVASDHDFDTAGIGANSQFPHPINFLNEDYTKYGESDDSDDSRSSGRRARWSGGDYEMGRSTGVLQRLRLQEYASQLGSIGTFDCGDNEKKYGQTVLTGSPQQRMGAHRLFCTTLAGRISENGIGQCQTDEMSSFLEHCPRYTD